LIKTSKNGHVKIVELLLRDWGINPSTHYNDELVKTAKNGYINIVKLLLHDGKFKTVMYSESY
jgi:hypothetical protein